MVKFELFIYKNANKALRKKGLYQEIKSILRKIKRIDHEEIEREFQNGGWKLGRRIHPSVSWSWDAYKDKVAVSVELSLVDAVHRDFLRAILAKKYNDLDILVYITSTFREPKFHNIKRDIEVFKELLDLPILLVGLT